MGLEERGIPAARGGKWSAVQVAGLLEAAGSPFGASVAIIGVPENRADLANVPHIVTRRRQLRMNSDLQP